MKRLVSNITEESILRSLIGKKGKISKLTENKTEGQRFRELFNHNSELSDGIVDIGEEIVEEKLDYLRKERFCDRDYMRINAVAQELNHTKVYLEEYDGKNNKQWAKTCNNRYMTNKRAKEREMLKIKNGDKVSGKSKK